MNIFDGILLLVILVAMWSGRQKGFIAGFVNLVQLVLCFTIALLGYSWLSAVVDHYIYDLGVWSLPLSFLFLYAFSSLLMTTLFRNMTGKLSERVQDNELNSWLGLIPGFIKGILYATVLSLLVPALPVVNMVSQTATNSKVAQVLTPPAQWLEDQLSPVFNDAIRQSMTRLTIEPDSDETVQLHFRVHHGEAMPSLEDKLLELVNEERKKEGLSILKKDTALQRVARAHCRDMFARGYFAHNNPDGQSPFDRMEAAGIHFTTAGENLALSPTVTLAHNGLMHSPGHRANILRPAFGRVGIGIIDGGLHGLMVAQEFRNP